PLTEYFLRNAAGLRFAVFLKSLKQGQRFHEARFRDARLARLQIEVEGKQLGVGDTLTIILQGGATRKRGRHAKELPVQSLIVVRQRRQARPIETSRRMLVEIGGRLFETLPSRRGVKLGLLKYIRAVHPNDRLA